MLRDNYRRRDPTPARTARGRLDVRRSEPEASHGRDVESPVEPEIPFPFLHDELARIIELNGSKPMTSAELADTINAEDRYRNKDGSPVNSSQISARVSKYPQLFERVDDGRIRLHSPERG